MKPVRSNPNLWNGNRRVSSIFVTPEHHYIKPSYEPVAPLTALTAYDVAYPSG
jgi:hypothetical protein